MSPDPKENVGDFDLWLTNDTQANEILGMVPPLVHGRDVSRMVSASCLQSIRAIHISGHIRTSRVPQSDSHYLIAMNDQQSHNNWAFGVEIVDSKSYDHCMIIVITTIDFTCFFISSFHPSSRVAPRTTSGCTLSASRPEEFGRLSRSYQIILELERRENGPNSSNYQRSMLKFLRFLPTKPWESSCAATLPSSWKLVSLRWAPTIQAG